MSSMSWDEYFAAGMQEHLTMMTRACATDAAVNETKPESLVRGPR